MAGETSRAGHGGVKGNSLTKTIMRSTQANMEALASRCAERTGGRNNRLPEIPYLNARSNAEQGETQSPSLGSKC